MEIKGAGEETSRGSGTSSSGHEVSLESSEEFNKELNRELNEIHSFGNIREAGDYHQASFFDSEYELPKPKYTYVKPQKELVVPHEYIVQTILRGSGFENGRTRI